MPNILLAVLAMEALRKKYWVDQTQFSSPLPSTETEVRGYINPGQFLKFLKFYFTLCDF